MNATQLTELNKENLTPRFTNEELTRRVTLLAKIVDKLLERSDLHLLYSMSPEGVEEITVDEATIVLKPVTEDPPSYSFFEKGEKSHRLCRIIGCVNEHMVGSVKCEKHYPNFCGGCGVSTKYGLTFCENCEAKIATI